MSTEPATPPVSSLAVLLANLPLVAMSAPSDPPIVLTPRATEVAGTANPHFSLDGIWQFLANIELASEGPLPANGGWKPIDVPGHWFTQGFEVPKKTAAGYRRSFSVPKGWADRLLSWHGRELRPEERILRSQALDPGVRPDYGGNRPRISEDAE